MTNRGAGAAMPSEYERRAAQHVRLERIVRVARFLAAALVFLFGNSIPNIGEPFVVLLGVFILGYGVIVTVLWVRARTPSAVEWASHLTLAADISLVGFALLVFAPDPGWAVYASGFLAITTGGLRFRNGAVLAAVSLSLTYLVISGFRIVVLGIPVGPAQFAIQLTSYLLAGAVLNQVLPEIQALRSREVGLYEPVMQAHEETGQALVITEDGRPVFWNKAFEDMTGRDADRLKRVLSISELVVPDAGSIEDPVDARRPFTARVLAREGQLIEVEVSVRGTRESGVDRRVWLIRDIASRAGDDDELRAWAMHDPLTGLPNRLLLNDRLNHAIAWAQRQKRQLSVLLIDLDGFKKVNDSLGHRAGDQVLVQVGARLIRALRESDTAARLGGDEFVVLLLDTPAAGAEHVARNLAEVIAAPIGVEGEPVTVGSSIGISSYPAHGRDAENLLRRADTAMYAAKRSGSGVWTFSETDDASVDVRRH